MLKALVIAILLICSLPGFSQLRDVAVYPVSEKTEIVLLNGVWDFKYIKGAEIPPGDRDFFKPDFTGSDWGKIDVPSNWELQGKAAPHYANDLEEGIGLYRTTFSVPEKFAKKNVFIRFEGVLYAYELFVNGEYVGKWASAFNAHQFDITPYLKRNRANILAVKVFTHTARETHKFDISDHWALSGIFRDVVLFSVPDAHFADFVFTSKVHRDSSANLTIQAVISTFKKRKNKKYILEGTLFDPKGIKRYSFNRPVQLSNKGTDSIKVETVLPEPRLWTAETPDLYKLTLDLYEGKELVQTITERVGIREVSIRNGILMVNNTAVRLKGVNMHEIHPERGSALTDEDRIADLELAKKGNINYIRTSHYPHHPRFFELCDSLGFYVTGEIPFNFSPEGVRDNLDYLPHLITRAEATIYRNKNHPSIIIWSVGNENRNAEIYRRVALYTEHRDPTRPRCFPQAPKHFAREWKETPEVFNVLAPHYLLPEQLESLAQEAKRPVIMTEYAHSLGLSTENLEENWEIVRKYPNLAGAAIWMWSDQGISRKRSVEEFLEDDNPSGVWVDSTTYHDGYKERGTDGIVYSNRYPQIDYWLARKVYSPIWVEKKNIKVIPGEQILEIELENRFDFISLDGFYCEWTLRNYGRTLQEETVRLSAPPKSTNTIEIPVSIPNIGPGEFILDLTFYDALGVACYETTVPVLTKEINYFKLNRESKNGDVEIKGDVKNNKSVMTSGKSLFSLDEEGEALLLNRHTGDTLLIGSPVCRVGRKLTITLAYQGERYDSTFYWNPYLLSDPTLLSQKIEKTKEGYEIIAAYRWEHPERVKQYIEGSVTFSMLPNGDITCAYDVKPYHATGVFMEFGLGFLLPEDYSTFRWLGEGPFVSVPGKSKYNERDVWALGKEDIRFDGNRAKTDLAAFYNDKDRGSGIGFIGDKSNFGVELIEDRIMFTDNALVSGFGTKVNFTKYPINAKDVASVQGAFKIVVLGKESELFDQVFRPLKEVIVEKPFLKSYGF